MSSHEHHVDLIGSLRQQLGPVLENSEQGMYVYLDDDHKFCNEKFAKMLGYASADEWNKMEGQFPVVFVDSGSQGTLVNAYMNAMEKGVGSMNPITWKAKDGSKVKTDVILVPIAHDQHLFALHFITKK